MFTHLHVRSYYSLLEGLASPGELARAAAASGMESLALTDHLYLTGAVEFYRACQRAGVRPLLGMELDLRFAPRRSPAYPPGALVLLAMDLAGWSSLCRLSSALLLEREGSPDRVASLELLDRYRDGLICLTGGRRGLLAALTEGGQRDHADQLAARLMDLYPGRLYVEIQAPPAAADDAASALVDLARRRGLPLVAAHDTFYLEPEEAILQRTLSAIRLVRPLDQLAPGDVPPPGASFASAEAMASRFAALPEALEATAEVASRCQLELPLGRQNFPRLATPPGTSPLEVLRARAEAGARERYGRITPPIRERLDHELEVIGGRGFESIFLIMEEVIAFARGAGIPYSSRGSAASSLVAHCLGITIPDPLFHNLYFERFLNPARATPPDIDTDLCSRRRDEVLEHVFTTYGAERVAMVATINRFRPRSALGDVAKAHGLPPEEVRRLVDALPYRFFRAPGGEEEGEGDAAPLEEMATRSGSARHQAIFRQALAILGIPRHLSVHPGGVVISPTPTTDLVPVTRSGAKGVVITQFDLDALPQLGLVKLDMLGIRGLTVLGDVATAIHSWKRSEHASSMEVLDAIPRADPQVGDALARGATIGCFQIESPGMRATLREIHARTVDDVVAALALYRPGPLRGGFKEAFVRRHNGEEPVRYLHPALEPVLRETYGVILYQEQVLRLAHDLAGLSLAEADLLRRAMSHFDPGKQLQTLKERFIEGAGRVSAVDATTAERIWDLMAAFAGYGFPKAHAASYAEVAWRSAWCKVHHPAEFMAAVLANWGGYYSQRVYLTEARRLGLDVRPPHVNHSRREFSVSYPQGRPALYMGLDQVRELTRRTQEKIQRERPFTALGDFLARVDPRPGEAESLIRCGALSGLGAIPALLAQVRGQPWRSGQPALFDLPITDAEDWTLAQKIAAQEEILGIAVEAHPLELAADRLAGQGTLTTIEATERVGQRVRVAGVRQTLRRSRTAQGEWMAFLSLEDLEGMLDVVFFPAAYRSAREVLTSTQPIVVEGVLEPDDTRGEPTLRAERAWHVG